MHRRLSLSLVLMLTLLGGTAIQAGPITLYTTSAVGASNLPIPNWATVGGGTNAFTIPFDGNSLIVSGSLLSTFAIFDEGTTVLPHGNTLPDLMIANTIVKNGEDDYLLTFEHPVNALGVRLLTNYLANEVVTFRDGANVVIDRVSLDALTSPNTRQFVGFSSSIPFSSVYIDTNGGAVQNEGIDLLEIGGTWTVPDPGSTLLLLGIGLTGLGAVRRRLRN